MKKFSKILCAILVLAMLCSPLTFMVSAAEDSAEIPFVESVQHKAASLGDINAQFSHVVDDEVEGNLYTGSSFGNYSSISFLAAANSVSEDQSYLTFYASKNSTLKNTNPFYQLNATDAPNLSVASGTSAYYVIDFDIASHGELLPYLDISVMLRRTSDGSGFPFSCNIEVASYLKNNGTWEHVTVIGDMATNQVYLYIDGEFMANPGYAYNDSELGGNKELSPKGVRIDFALSAGTYDFVQGQNLAVDNFAQRVYTEVSLTNGLDKAIASKDLTNWSGFVSNKAGKSLPALASVDGVSYSNSALLSRALNTNDTVNVEFLSKPFAPVSINANAVINTNGMKSSDLFTLASTCTLESQSGNLYITSAPFNSNYSETKVDKTAAAKAMKYSHSDNILSYFAGNNYNVNNGRGFYLVTDSYTGSSYINERVYSGTVDNNSNTYNDWYPNNAKITYKQNADQHIIIDFDIAKNDDLPYIFKTVSRTSSGGSAWDGANDIDMAAILSAYPLGEFVHVTMVLTTDTRDTTIFINGSYVKTAEKNITAVNDNHYFQAMRNGGNSASDVSLANLCIRTTYDATLTSAVNAQNINAWSGNYYNNRYQLPTTVAMATIDGEPYYNEASIENALFGNKEAPAVVKILNVFDNEITVNCDATIYTYNQDVKFVDKDGNALVPTDGVIKLDVPYIANKLENKVAVTGNSSVAQVSNAIKYNDSNNLFVEYFAASEETGKWGTEGYRNATLVTNVETGDVMYVESADGDTFVGTNEYVNFVSTAYLSYVEGENEYIVVDFDCAYDAKDGTLFLELVSRVDNNPYRSAKIFLKDLGLATSHMSHVTIVYDFAGNNVYAFVDGNHVLTYANAIDQTGYALYKNGTSIASKELKMGSNSLDTVSIANLLVRRNDADATNDDLGAALAALDVTDWEGNVYNSDYVSAELPAIALVDGVAYGSVVDLNKSLAIESSSAKKVVFKHNPGTSVQVFTDAVVETNDLGIDLDYNTGAYKFQNDDYYHVCTGTDYAYASNRLVVKNNPGSSVYEFITINKDNCNEFATPVLWFYNNDPENVEVQVVYYLYGEEIKPLERDAFVEDGKKYELSYFELSHSLQIGEAVDSFPVASKALSETWYYVNVATVDFGNAAIDMKYAANVNSNIEFIFYVNKAQTTTNTGKIVEINGVEYVAFVYTLAPHQIDELIRVEFEVVDADGNVYMQRYDVSFVDYASALLASDHDDATKQLVMALLNYANEAHALFENGVKMDAVTELLETYAELLVNDELGQTADTADLDKVIRSAALKLESAPEFVFKLAMGYRGTISFTYTGVDGAVKSYSVEFDSRKGEKLVTLNGLNVYDMCGDFTIEVTLTDDQTTFTGTYNLSTYANGIGEDNAFAVALYNYAKLAKEYKAEGYIANA